VGKRFAIAALAVASLAAFGAAAQTHAQYPSYPTTPTPAPTPAPKAVTIAGTSLSDYAFAPKTLKIKAGKKAHWSWSSNAAHNVTFSKLNKHSQTTATGTYGLKFKTTGTFHYFCSVHGFTGKIVVRK
jgi:plastocyanin